MKLEGEDRELPYDVPCIIICAIGLVACWAVPVSIEVSAWAYPVWAVMIAYQAYVLLPLLDADSKRIKRNIECLERENRRLKLIVEDRESKGRAE